MSPLLIRTLHAKHKTSEVDKKPNGDHVQDGVHSSGDFHVQFPSDPVDAKAERENCIIKRRVVMMNVGHSCHDDEGQIVQNPPNSRIKSGVVDLIDVRLAQFLIASLPAKKVPDEQQTEANKTCGTSPVHERISKKVVLHDTVIPGAHAQTDVQYWPLPELRGQVILLVWVGDQSVVRSHHGNVQVDEIFQERRLVRARVTRRHYEFIVSNHH